MPRLFDRAIQGDRRRRIALGGTLLLCTLAVIYYVNVLKPTWLRQEVSTYLMSTIAPVSLAATENTHKAAHSVGQFILDKKSHTEAFVDELRERADEWGAIAKDKAIRATLVQEVFARHFFTEKELAQAVDAAVEAHYKALTEAANTLARRIAEEYPYELTQRAGVNAQAVKVNYGQMVDYSRSLHDGEVLNSWGRFGVNIAAGALAGSGIALAGKTLMAKGSLWAIAAGAATAVVGWGVDSWLDSRQRQKMIIATNTMLDEKAAKLDGDLEKAMTAHTKNQIYAWYSGLNEEIIAYRENL